VLPILHLNGYKIANPVLARSSDRDVRAVIEGNGITRSILSRATIRTPCTRRSQPRWIAVTRKSVRFNGGPELTASLNVHAGLPLCCARPKDGQARRWSTANRWRVPFARIRSRWRRYSPSPATRQLEEWMRSYRPDELFDDGGSLVPDLAELAPNGDLRMGANPIANGGRVSVDLDLPDFRDYALDVQKPAATYHESPRQLGMLLRDMFVRDREQANFACSVRTRQIRIGWAMCSRPRTGVSSAPRSPSTIMCRRMAALWRC
jgi:xylulose-5-phosphate/fructose-6-phosphate phosphoketolase